MEGINVVAAICGDTTYGRQANEEIRRLASKIKKCGFDVEYAYHPWPRDKYVYCDGRYVTKPAGEGGSVQIGNGFLLVSEKLFYAPKTYDYYAKHEIQNINPAKVKTRAEKSYPGRRVHVLPAGYNPGRAGSLNGGADVDHIDLTCLLVPSRDLLIVDQSFYRINHFDYDPKKEFHEVAEKENLKLEFYNPHSLSSYKYYPANCLILPGEKNEEIVFANSNVKPFLRLLNKYDIKFIEVDFKYSPEIGGSIRCRTNVKDKRKSLDSLFPR